MRKEKYVEVFGPGAIASEKKTGFSAIAILAQGALESAWGDVAPGNMLFGVKDTDGVNGNEQLLVTTEYSRNAHAPFKRILSVTPVIRNGEKWFKYKIKDYFRKYETVEECMNDHVSFFTKNKRYAKALEVRHDPYLFIDAIAKASYATDPNYAKLLKSIAASIETLMPKDYGK